MKPPIANTDLAAGLLVLVLAAWPCGGKADQAPADDGAADGATAVDISSWICALCPYPLGWRGEWSLGPGYADGTDPKFADYRGIDDDGFWLSLGGRARFLDDEGLYLDIRAHDLGLDSRRLEARGGRQGAWEWWLHYKEIPKFRGYGTASPYAGVGSAILTLPAGWQPAATTDAMPGLAGSLTPVSLKTTRKTFEASFRSIVNSRWQWEATAAHQEKSGTRPFGAGLFTINTSHFPAPVDYTTDRLDLALQYTGERGSLTAGVGGSRFDNGGDAVTWDNPFDPIEGSDRFRAALAPDNTYYQARIAGAWRPSRRLRLTGRFSLGRAEQDQPLLPYTINEAIPSESLPVNAIDGRVDTGNLDLGGTLSLRLSRQLDLDLRYRRRERDNDTPVLFWDPVITDLVQRPPTPNRPYSFDRQDLSASLNYAANAGVRVEAGVKRRDMDRTLQAVTESDETTWWMELGWYRWAALGLRLGFEDADRDVPRYQLIQDPGLPENPLMRKFNQAARERQRVLASIDWTPLHWLSAGLAWHVTDDDYPASTIGLIASEEESLSLDIAVHPGGAVTAHAFVSDDTIDATIDGAENFTLPWRAVTRDDFLTTGVGVDFETEGGWSSGLDYAVARAEGDIRTATAPGDAPFPTLVTELRNLRLHVRGRISTHWDWQVIVEQEHYSSRDWQVDEAGVGDVPAVLTMGELSPDYDATLVSLLAVYRL